MQYRTVPNNGDRLSILGFGCMRLPVRNRKIDEPRAMSQIRSAIDKDINYLDTAWPYHAGQSEILLGKALQDGYRAKVKLATKLPTWMINTRADMDRYLAAQLKKLDTDHIDYYLLHSLNGDSYDKLRRLDVDDFLEKSVKAGKIVNPGFSFHGQAEDFTRIVDSYPWVFCQIQYNYLDQNTQAGTQGLKYASGKGLAVMIMEPLRGGGLGLPTPAPAIEELWKTGGQKRTPAEWALRWVWNHPEVTVVLSGMNDEQQIDENLAIAKTAQASALTEEELALVDRVGRKYHELMKVGCTGCGYCMPCPSDVQIPLCFDEYNSLHMFGRPEEAKFRYAFRLSGEITGSNRGFASQCVECGSCVDKCPQHIPIPQVLAQVAAEMDGPDLEDRIVMARRFFKIEASS